MFTEAMAKRIEIWPIDKLDAVRPQPQDPFGPAGHADRRVSIAEFGFVNPVLVDSDAGILAGHGRLLGAQKLKLKEVPVIVLDHLTPAQRRAYLIADNKLAELAGWDEDLLRLELRDLELADFDLGVIGFSDEELRDLLAEPDEVSPGLTDEDAAPEAPERPVSQAGDSGCWANTGCCAATRRISKPSRRLMGGEHADLVFTDPPYNVDYEGYTDGQANDQG